LKLQDIPHLQWVWRAL